MSKEYLMSVEAIKAMLTALKDGHNYLRADIDMLRGQLKGINGHPGSS